jgi:hypothetical protein
MAGSHIPLCSWAHTICAFYSNICSCVRHTPCCSVQGVPSTIDSTPFPDARRFTRPLRCTQLACGTLDRGEHAPSHREVLETPEVHAKREGGLAAIHEASSVGVAGLAREFADFSCVGIESRQGSR